jgi:hypothetical protein
MRLQEWCKQAQDDQFGRLGAPPAFDSHIYSNHAFSRSPVQPLIDERCLARIEEELADLEFDGLRAPNGEAAALVDRAGQAQHQKARGQRAKADDLRLLGPQVPLPDPSVVFARLDRIRRAPRSTTASGYGRDMGASPASPAAPGAGAAIGGSNAPTRVSWVTLLSEMMDALKGLRLASKDELVVTVYRKVGLKPASIDAVERRCIQLFRLKSRATLHRPHCWSGGFADRFSPYSPRRDGFGSAVNIDAADLQGLPGLPEAVTLASDFEEIPPHAPEYEAMCDELARINPALAQDRVGDDEYIAGNIESAQALPPRGYAPLKDLIVRSLTPFDRACESRDDTCQCAPPASAAALTPRRA